ncbi:MAG: M48 family metalloprotease [Thermoanaerobaculia bacterium]
MMRTEVVAALPPAPFVRDLLAYLKESEAALWSWFAGTSRGVAHVEATRLELLKQTYRFDPADYPELYASAERARAALGLEVAVTIYQSTTGSNLNAFLLYVPGEAHVVFEGSLLSTLSPTELEAALAHELTHYLLFEAFDGDLLTASQLLTALQSHPSVSPSHVETARLFSLHLESHADRGALLVCRDPLLVISSIVKTQTGLREVHAESYLRQADEIFSRADVRAEELTHPESFIRARALGLWASSADSAWPEIERMIEGPARLSTPNLVMQTRLSELTRRLVRHLLAPDHMRTDAVSALARKYFPDIDSGELAADDSIVADLRTLDASLIDYVHFVLLDFATIDGDLEDVPLISATRFAEALGSRDRFLELVTKELGLTKKVAAKLDKDSAAHQQGGNEAVS